MNITIDAAIASIVTALIVGTITMITTIVANRNSLRQQEAQWAREEKKADREERQAEKNRELELKKAITNQLQEIYGNSVSSLTTLLIYDDAAKRNQKEYAVNLGEAQKWLSFVAAFHYDKKSEEYISFLKLYRDTYETYAGHANVMKLREMIIEFASKDPRLQT
jgi:hypothetical protein